MPQDLKSIDKEAREAWKTAPISDLIQHIVGHYHLLARLELARMESHSEEVALLHGQDHPVLLEIREEITRLATELRAHLIFEERETFPAILNPTPGSSVSLLEPMKKVLMEEHEAEAAQVRHIRALTERFEPCSASRAAHGKLQAALKALSEDLQQHLFLENQILFPRTS